MPNVFTRVPDRAVPAPPRWLRAILRVADLFMVAMYSRPPTGTLATTWVTPSTLWLTASLAIVAVAVAILLLLSQPFGGAVSVVLGGLLLVLAVGAGSVAVVGLAQRRG